MEREGGAWPAVSIEADEGESELGEGTATVRVTPCALHKAPWIWENGPIVGQIRVSLGLLAIQKGILAIIFGWCQYGLGGKSLGRVKAVLGTAAKFLKGGPNWCTNPYGLGCCEGQINLNV